MEEASYKSGTVIFSEGDPGASMYVVLSGKVKIVKKARGVDKTLAVFGPGDFFGEMAIISGKPRSASAVAEEDCRLQVLERPDFLSMVQCNRKEDRMTLSVMEKLCDRLRDTDLQIENLLIGDHLNRVADALAQMKPGVSVGDVAGRVGLPQGAGRGIVAKLAAAGESLRRVSGSNPSTRRSSGSTATSRHRSSTSEARTIPCGFIAFSSPPDPERGSPSWETATLSRRRRGRWPNRWDIG